MAITREMRARHLGHKAGVVWLSGLSGAGKTTLARAAERVLFERGLWVSRLDGDVLRRGLCQGLDFSIEGRDENLRRAGEAAALLADAGCVVLAAFITPLVAQRARLREQVGAERFALVHVDASLACCEARDPKGLYAKARRGEVALMTGLDSPWERPRENELALRLDTETQGESVCADALVRWVMRRFSPGAGDGTAGG